MALFPAFAQAFVVGILLHIGTTVLFEAGDGHAFNRNSSWPPASASPRVCLPSCESCRSNFRQTKLFIDQAVSACDMRYYAFTSAHPGRDHRTFYLNLLHQLDVLRVELTGPARGTIKQTNRPPKTRPDPMLEAGQDAKDQISQPTPQSIRLAHCPPNHLEPWGNHPRPAALHPCESSHLGALL